MIGTYFHKQIVSVFQHIYNEVGTFFFQTNWILKLCNLNTADKDLIGILIKLTTDSDKRFHLELIFDNLSNHKIILSLDMQ